LRSQEGDPLSLREGVNQQPRSYLPEEYGWAPSGTVMNLCPKMGWRVGCSRRSSEATAASHGLPGAILWVRVDRVRGRGIVRGLLFEADQELA
jgi:hypothetical protein